jgi:hypothetical protein
MGHLAMQAGLRAERRSYLRWRRVSRSIDIRMPRQIITVSIASRRMKKRQRDADHRRSPTTNQQLIARVEELGPWSWGPASGEAGEAALGLLGDPHAPAEQKHEAADQEQPAEQTPFLRHCREDEVGMLLGQIVEMALGAVEEALAENAARADRDLRLRDVIAGAERVLLRD